MKKVQLGDRVEDKMTKAGGIVWGITSYLHGCNRIHVMPERLQDGNAPKILVFDEPQVTVLKEKAYQIEHPDPEPKTKKPPGGPAYLNASKPSRGSVK